MTFVLPRLLWLLLAPVVLLGWELRRRRGAAVFFHPHIARAEAGTRTLTLVSRLSATLSGSGARARPWFCLGLALAIVALARPQWGRIDEPVFEQSREIVIALDLSRSMLTPDVKPSRLERAKLLIQSLLEKLAGERVGLVSFAGTAFLQAPLSADYEILREFLPSLGPNFMPIGGTNYKALITAAADAFGSSGAADRFLIVLSDGGATDEDWRPRVGQLKGKGIKVIALGIGTGTGALIPDGAGGYVKDERGAVVMSKLESDTLRELASLTGGVYRDASEWVDLPKLLQSTVEAGRKGRFTERNNVRYAERFQWALVPALLCLLVSFFREFPVRPKPRDIRLAASERQVSAERIGRKSGRPGAIPAGLALLLFSLASGVLPRSLAQGAAAPPGALLGRIVGRLSNHDANNALDWLELGRETLSWGEQLKSAGQPVPAGPVHDALDAVDLGAALDRKAGDWAKLRSDLQALLKNPEDKKQKPPPKPKQNSQQKRSNSPPSGGSQQDQSQAGSPPDSSESNPPANQPQNSPAPGESAFGQMNSKTPPPPPPSGGTQKIGGERKSEHDSANVDPALAPLLQKMEEVRDRDSPAELFQMFERNEPRPPETKGKDW